MSVVRVVQRNLGRVIAILITSGAGAVQLAYGLLLDHPTLAGTSAGMLLWALYIAVRLFEREQRLAREREQAGVLAAAIHEEIQRREIEPPPGIAVENPDGTIALAYPVLHESVRAEHRPASTAPTAPTAPEEMVENPMRFPGRVVRQSRVRGLQGSGFKSRSVVGARKPR